MLEHTQQERWIEVTLEHLTLGLECGRSGAFSGITANLAVMVVADRLIAEAGTASISEITEMKGTAHPLKRRAANPEAARNIEAYVNLGIVASAWTADQLFARGPPPCNIEGGLTTNTEKSSGCITKGGITTINEGDDGSSIESMAGKVAVGV